MGYTTITVGAVEKISCSLGVNHAPIMLCIDDVNIFLTISQAEDMKLALIEALTAARGRVQHD